MRPVNTTRRHEGASERGDGYQPERSGAVWAGYAEGVGWAVFQ